MEQPQDASDEEIPTAGTPRDRYSIGVADVAYTYYNQRAKKARWAYRTSETALPVAAAIEPNSAVVPAILGAIAVIVAGLRAVFHWQENYLRFSGAREAIEAERRKFHTCTPPYDGENRAAKLTDAVSRIEQGEMAGWVKIASDRPRAS